jgi:hypothetical protein
LVTLLLLPIKQEWVGDAERMRNFVRFEWQFPENDEWEALAPPSPEVTTPARRGQRVGYSLLGIALLAIVAWLFVQGRQSAPPRPEGALSGAPVTLTQSDLQQVIAQETGPGQNDKHNNAPALTIQIQVVEGEHRWAMVDVVAPPPSQPGLASPATRQAASTLAAPLWLPHEIAAQTQQVSPPFAYREMRFYQQTEQGWQRIEPPVALWGEPGVMETIHLRFVFHKLDRVTVERMAAESETLYVDLRRIVGLLPTTGDKLTIEVAPQRVTGDWIRTENGILLSSPLLLRIPIDSSRATVVGQMLRTALIDEIIGEVLQQTAVRWQWQPTVDGLRRWLRQTDTLSFPPPIALASAEHTLHLLDTPPKLSDLQFILVAVWVDHSVNQTQIDVAHRLIEYIVATYGAESLAKLLRAFGQHEYWTTLIPAVFEVPVAEFEASWHNYLREKNHLDQSNEAVPQKADSANP